MIQNGTMVTLTDAGKAHLRSEYAVTNPDSWGVGMVVAEGFNKDTDAEMVAVCFPDGDIKLQSSGLLFVGLPSLPFDLDHVVAE